MTGNRSQATEGERDQLRRFVRVVARMSNRRFIRRLKEQDHILHFGDEIEGPDYDREDLDAFLTDFRKVAMSDSEPVYLTKVLVTVGKLASDGFRSELKGLRSQLLPLLDGRSTMMDLGFDHDGQPVTRTPTEVLETLVNGEIFHVDPARASEAESVRNLQPLFYLWPIVHFFILPVLRACVWLLRALWRDGILQPADYPAECRPPDTARVDEPSGEA